MRIGFPSHEISQVWDPTWVRRRRATRKPGAGKVEPTPPKVARTGLTEETAAKRLEYPIHLLENVKESLDAQPIVRRMPVIAWEGNGIRHLDRHGPNAYVDIERMKYGHVVAEELGD